MFKQLNVGLMSTKSVLQRARGSSNSTATRDCLHYALKPLVPLGQIEAVEAKVKERNLSKERQEQTQ